MNRLVLVILICVLLLTSCASKHGKIVAPAAPKVLPVTVHNGTISGKDLENVIKNHINAWKYIEELKKLGGFKR